LAFIKTSQEFFFGSGRSREIQRIPNPKNFRTVQKKFFGPIFFELGWTPPKDPEKSLKKKNQFFGREWSYINFSQGLKNPSESTLNE